MVEYMVRLQHLLLKETLNRLCSCLFLLSYIEHCYWHLLLGER